MQQDLLERVLNLSRRMAETRQLKPLLEYAMDEAMSLVGAEYGYMVLLDQENRQLDFRVTRGPQGERSMQDQISMSILSEVVLNGKPIILRDANSDPKWNQAKSVVMLRLRSVMCLPLISRGEIIGAIYVLFANQAAVYIENAALNDALEARVAQRTSELEQAMSHIEQGWTDAVEANRVRTILLGNVAHDLRSPLSIVIESLSLMHEGVMGDLNAEQSDWIGKALDAANHVLRLTNDVFDLMKLEMGGLALYPQETNLEEFLRKNHSIGLGLPRPEGVELKLDLALPLPTVWLDPVRINQVILNLVSNALKFTNQGSITLYAQHLPENDEVLIGVVDTGEGIPEDKLPLVFQRFQQVDKKVARRRVGTGLGLAISRELVEMHKGRIWVESQVGVGSNFKFVLPIHPKTSDPEAQEVAASE